MEFSSQTGLERPVRLCESTRKFAYDSLNRKYGLDTLKTPFVTVDDAEAYKKMTATQQYDISIRTIASKAPIRICENEMLSGAATLGNALSHIIPVDLAVNDWFSGVSHLTADFFTVLKIGVNGIREKINESMKKHTEPKKLEFLHSCLESVESMSIWHKRYLEALKDKPEYRKNYENLLRVPFEPARNFYEAVQSLWFCFAFMRLCGIWPGIGRIDVLLGDYLKKDLESGALTLDEAREILAHFFIKGCEWIAGGECFGGSGDAQHYQNIVLSGINEEGKDVTNEVTYLVLDIVEETGISDFPVTVRISRNTDEKLIKRVAEVIRYGGGTVAVYNEDKILSALDKMGYDKKEAANFANDGCWEVQIPGKTNFSYVPFDSLLILQQKTLKGYSEEINFNSFEELISRFEKDVGEKVEEIYNNRVLTLFADEKFNFAEANKCTVVSLFENCCIEKGLSYREGGTRYYVISPHIGGLSDVVNSLYAIKKVVFDEKTLSFRDFMKILKNNWENEEDLRNRILTTFEYYGNDNDEADEIAVSITDSFSKSCLKFDGKTPVRFVGGVSTFGRQLEWAPQRFATPFGRKAGDILAGNCSPTPGTDKNGVTATIKSYCKINHEDLPTGAALDVGFVPTDTEKENTVTALCGLIKGFVTLGGFFMQIDTVNRETLIDAQKNPQNYTNLSVRVSGWNARFVTLNREWQNMIIERTKE